MTYQAKTEAVFFLNRNEFKAVVKRGMKRVNYEERIRLEEMIKMKMWSFSEIKFPALFLEVSGNLRFCRFRTKST